MKLFDNFEAVKFPEENLILITHNSYLYYIYDSVNKNWRKHRNAGHDYITVSNYPDVSKKELEDAMDGVFPEKETDFLRLCHPSQIHIGNMLNILETDYAKYMSVPLIYDAIETFLSESNKHFKAFEKIKKLLDEATTIKQDVQQIFDSIKNLSFDFIGRDIFKQEIGIVDGHDYSSYFWIMPVRVIDYSDTNCLDNVSEMKSAEISIEEDDVAQYLTPFLYKRFDEELEANKKRVDEYWIDDNGNEQTTQVSGFEWYLTYNFYTFESVKSILKDIRETIDALSCGQETDYTQKLKIKRGFSSHKLIYAKDLTEEQIEKHNANRPKEDNTSIDLIINFYNRFIYRMEYMMKVGKEKGFNLISFMGP